jgi:hypothetical protein
MSDDKQNSNQINNKLLTTAELAVCQKIAVLDTELAGRRAAILVAINDGATHAQASEQTGLTVGQIRYLLTTFRRKRLAIFPDDVLSQAQLAPGVDEGEKTEKSEAAQKDEAPLAEVVKVEKKLKKEKAKAKKKEKGKMSKKTKKDKVKKEKKDKKSKKGKAKKASKKKSKK